MPEEHLQIAFEIKSACDEISSRLLRWHWEQHVGDRSLEALLAHIERRRAESPEYYERLPDYSGKKSWEQLDTTLCIRVLLDPEQDAAKPLDMLGNTAHPAAARRACAAVRSARNEAAHASDRESAARSALLFSEAIEALEDGYANSAFTEFELSVYYRQAEEYLARLDSKPIASAKGRAKAPAEGKAASRRKGSAESTALTPVKNSPANQRKGTANSARRERRSPSVNPALVFILAAAVIAGLAVRAGSMGLI